MRVDLKQATCPCVRLTDKPPHHNYFLYCSLHIRYTARHHSTRQHLMAKIITCNTNGIRSASRKGFFEWMAGEDPDVVCIQETKAQIDQLGDPIFSPQGYHCYYNDAQKKGYSGTAIYSKVKPTKVMTSRLLQF